jgi:hypothetical protein
VIPNSFNFTFNFLRFTLNSNDLLFFEFYTLFQLIELIYKGIEVPLMSLLLTTKLFGHLPNLLFVLLKLLLSFNLFGVELN